jgi:hypothetical protein
MCGQKLEELDDLRKTCNSCKCSWRLLVEKDLPNPQVAQTIRKAVQLMKPAECCSAEVGSKRAFILMEKRSQGEQSLY